MESRDPLRWSQQQSALKSSEFGAHFLKIFEFWMDAAEKLREEDPNFPAYDSVQKAYVITLEEFGPVRNETVADMLMLAVNFWAHGVQLAEGMTPIETAMVHEAVFRATERLQEMAESDVT